MSNLEQRICDLASPNLSVADIVKQVGCDRSVVYRCIEKYNLVLKQRKKPSRSNDSLKLKILSLNDGTLTSKEIAAQVGCAAKYVQSVLNFHNQPRLPKGAVRGESNPAWVCGRIIDHDGYASVVAPLGHQYARKDGRIAEHRLVMEQKLGRYLEPLEVVDHIDGLHLHNCPSNLRVFESNVHHLRATISGLTPNWSQEGREKQFLPTDLRLNAPRIDTYRQKKANGDVRLQQILLALLKLGKDSPHLLGTLHHLEQAQIDYSCETKIKQALEMLSL